MYRRMQTGEFLGLLLLLESLWGILGAPVAPATLPRTQEDFDLNRFMGQWFEVAVVSDCPYYMKRQKGSPVIIKLGLQNNATEGKIKMRGTLLKQGTCMRISVDYNLTNTSGQFLHHFAKFNANVESYVVRTNYDEYAMMVMLSTEQPSGRRSTLIKLYSRAVEVSVSVLDDFRTLVRDQGMNDNNIIIKQNQGECVLREHMTMPTALP